MLIEDNLSQMAEDKVKLEGLAEGNVKLEAPRFGNWNKFIPDMSNEAEVKLRVLRDKKNMREMRRKTRKNLESMQEMSAVKRRETDLATALAAAPVTPPRVRKAKDCP